RQRYGVPETGSILRYLETFNTISSKRVNSTGKAKSGYASVFTPITLLSINKKPSWSWFDSAISPMTMSVFWKVRGNILPIEIIRAGSHLKYIPMYGMDMAFLLFQT